MSWPGCLHEWLTGRWLKMLSSPNGLFVKEPDYWNLELMKKLKLVNCHIAAAVVWVVFEPCDPVSVLLVMLWASAQPSSTLGQGCNVGWHERRTLPRPQLPSFCLPVKAKPKVNVNAQGCDCHLRWARETLSWPFLPITNLWTSPALAWWLISSAAKTMVAVTLCF